MILSTLVISQSHFEMFAGLHGHPVHQNNNKRTQLNLMRFLFAFH